jgi:hypothetical protein
MTGLPLAAVTLQLNISVSASTPSDALAVTLQDPVAVGVPEIRPVLVTTDRPGGKPVALYESGLPAGSDATSCSDTTVPTRLAWFPGLDKAGTALLVPDTSGERDPYVGPGE